jgi:hypothetical protein
MATPPLPEAELRRTLAVYEDHGGNESHTAAALGISRGALQNRLAGIKRTRTLALRTEIRIAEAPPADEPIGDLIARKKAGMERANAHEEWAKLIPVAVQDTLPIGLFLVGDPHVDDDHCDIGRLEHDLTTVGKTKGFFAGHVGDFTNNWVGRLARLYANQSTTAKDAQRLVEWMFGLCPSLFAINGNHDLFDGGDVLTWIIKAGVHQDHGARMALRWPGGHEVRIHARHDFPGRSQFSSTHGLKRELLFGHRDHVLVAGHIHVDEARIEPGADGDVHWMFRVSGYKVIDDFAKERHFHPKRLAPGVALVIDPAAKVSAEVVKPFWCVEEGADWLKFKRKRAAR